MKKEIIIGIVVLIVCVVAGSIVYITDSQSSQPETTAYVSEVTNEKDDGFFDDNNGENEVIGEQNYGVHDEEGIIDNVINSEINFSNIEEHTDEAGNSMLLSIDGYRNGTVFTRSTIVNMHGKLFTDGIVKMIRLTDSPSNFKVYEMYTYSIIADNQISVLGGYGFDSNIIIVERRNITDTAQVFICRDNGDERWFIHSSYIDFSSMRIEKDEDGDDITVFDCY